MIKTLLDGIMLWLRTSLFVLFKVPFILLVLAFGIYAFCFNDQGLDLMAAFGLGQKDPWYLPCFILFLIFWAAATWNTSRILLGGADLRMLAEGEPPKFDQRTYQSIRILIKWMPRLLGIIPYFIFIWGYGKENGTLIAGPPLITALIAAIHFVLFVKRKKFTLSASPDLSYDWQGEKNLATAITKTGTKTTTWVMAAMTVLAFTTATFLAWQPPTSPARPGLILLSGFIVYTALGLLVNRITNKFRIPVLLLLILFAIFVSKFNNNHSLQTCTTAADDELVSNRPSDSIYFAHWLQGKFADGVYDSLVSNNYIFIVAAEGGGIRSCYWTNNVLQKLQSEQPGFYNRTFAVTGASGGSIGLGFLYNYFFEKKRTENDFLIPADESQALDDICSADYLSRVTYGLMYPDLLQRFLFFPVESFDRGSYLANSFDEVFSHNTNVDEKHILSRNYLKMWSSKDFYRYPAILYNSIYNERGSKAIFSPFVLSPRYYADVLDVLSVTRVSVPSKEAMLSSARFPLITPPGLMHRKQDDKLKPFGHLSDGGTFDNTAIQTAQQTALMVKRGLRSAGKESHFKIAIIYIDYGAQPLLPDQRPFAQQKFSTPIERGHETSFIDGGVNALFRWIYSGTALSVELDEDLKVLDFALQNPYSRKEGQTHRLPLGWYLSETSKQIMSEQVDSTERHGKLATAMRRFNTMFNANRAAQRDRTNAYR